MSPNPSRISALPIALTLAAVLGTTALTGCSQDPQEKYESATEQLKDAREARNSAQEKLQSKKDELKKLQDKLDDAENNLQQARAKVDDASQAVDKTVNDQVLFRTIQRELLNKDKFDKAAISVGVQDRVVTLTGNVPDEKTHKQALEAAKSQAGVKNVVDQLQVQSNNAQKQPSNASGQHQNQSQDQTENPAPDQDQGDAPEQTQNADQSNANAPAQ